MALFVIQTVAGTEERVARAVRALPYADGLVVYHPRRKLRHRRRGKAFDAEVSLFPGYLFVETTDAHRSDAEILSSEFLRQARQITGFVRFLGDGGVPRPLEGDDLRLIRHLLSYGEVIGKSVVSFDKNQRIRVEHGPMSGLEGRIVKVDKRKGRARVRLDLYAESFLVDFGFEVLVPGTESSEISNR